jgi:hypothetical protein
MRINNLYEVEFISAVNNFFTREYIASNMLEAAMFADKLANEVGAELISINLVEREVS